MDHNQIAKLVIDVQNNDETALSTLYQETCNSSYLYALKLTKNEHDAMDAVQNTYIIMVEKISSLRDPKTFMAWIRTVLLNECKKILKKNGKYFLEDEENEGYLENIEDENTEFLPENIMEDEDKKRIIFEVIDNQLSDIQKQTLLLFYYDEFKIAEIAEITGANENTVKNRLFKSKNKLRKALDNHKKSGVLAVVPMPLITVLLRELAVKNTLTAVQTTGIAGNVSAATGTSLVSGSGAAIATTVTAATVTPMTAASATTIAATMAATTGLAAKIAALPIITKVISGIIAVTIVTTAVTIPIVLDNKPKPTGTMPISPTPEITVSAGSSPGPAILPGYSKLSESELKNIENLFTIDNYLNRTNDEGNWNFLTCIYNDPSEINLDEVLYDCAYVRADSNIYNAILEEVFDGDLVDRPSTLSVYSSEKINEYLLKKTGLKMDDKTKKISHEYFEKYNVYYHLHGDSNYVEPVFKSGQKSSVDNTYIIDYRSIGISGTESLNFTVTFKMVDNNITFISNVVTKQLPPAEITIPDPSKSGTNTEIVMRDPLYQELKINLEFAGLSKEEIIRAFNIGTVTSKIQSENISISYPDGYEGKQIETKKGSCLILFVKNNDSVDSHIVVLDYLNKKTYINKTLINADRLEPAIELKHLTGNQIEDIILSCVPNGSRSGILFEVYRFDDSKGTDNENFKRIYYNFDKKTELLGERLFTGYLIDDYKAVIECKDVNFKETVSLLDVGFSKKDLEIDDRLDPDSDEYMKTQFFRCYKNGIIQRDRLQQDVRSRGLDDIEGIQFEVSDTVNPAAGVPECYNFKLLYYMETNNWTNICSAYAYLKYDAGKDTFVVYKASIYLSNN